MHSGVWEVQPLKNSLRQRRNFSVKSQVRPFLEFIFSSVWAANVVQWTVCYRFFCSLLSRPVCFGVLFPKIEERHLRQQSGSRVSLLRACHHDTKFNGMLPFRRKECRASSGRCLQIYVFVLAPSCLPCLLRCLLSAARVLCLNPFSVFNFKKGEKKKYARLCGFPNVPCIFTKIGFYSSSRWWGK